MKWYSFKSASGPNGTRDRRCWIVLLCAPIVAVACFQQVDTGATLGTQDQINKAAIPPPTEPVTTTFKPDPPAGSLVNGDTATEGDACSVTNAQAMDIVTTSCAGCHSGQAPVVSDFDILDLAGTKTGLAHGQSFAGNKFRYLIPGDPAKSLVYFRIVKGSMPQGALDPSGIQVRKPTLSDISLLNGWIKLCIGTDPMPGVGVDPALLQ